MRHSVITPLYRLRKMVDGVLSKGTKFVPFNLLASQLKATTFKPAPSGWLALYTMVTFRPDIGYAEVRRKAEWQNRILDRVVWGGVFMSGLVGMVAAGLWAARAKGKFSWRA
jgi:kynurenine 3-monooxygenase